MSSIWSALSGIRAHQFMLDVVGTNLANTNSVGYKASRVTFAEMMNQTLRPASSGTETTGGTNPVQIGLGVEIGAVTRDFEQGALQDTGNPLDLSMDGNGFMVLNDGTRQVYLRSATFAVDANNYLVESVTGYRLLNVDNEAIDIPYNVQIPAKKTLNIAMAGNLSTSAEVPQIEVLKTIAAFQAGGVAAAETTDINDLDSTSSAYADGDVITIEGSLSDGTEYSTTFTYGAANDGTTLGDMMDIVQAELGTDATVSMDSEGNMLVTSATSGAATLSLSFDNTSGTGETNWTSHTLYVNVDGTDGGTRTSSTTIFDSRGKEHTLTLTFERVDEREWDMTASLGDSDGTLTKSSVTGIRFNTDGSFNSIAGGGTTANQLTIDFGTSAESQTLVLDFGTSSGFDGLTQFGGSSTASVTSQDGYAAGTLKSFSINADGTIQGLYTNDQRQSLGQIMVATFDNPEGLENLGQGIWGTTINSGEAVLGAAQSGRAGTIQSSVLESSNVESAEELTRLIVAQHGFQLSTRAMAVSNSIIQELARII